ncbi:hypothetical protein GMRT_10061 [Giardia muris]|uniref:Uncharacterized protein n=1 Tax=Giardia muris TaxID=5742 RepID=A0A4Z1SZK2_GIAMU|nr:hypothetical protein GMRT_10061 [Giardia muris]|eukprot:TNJ27083.1 hypothetical protein GMRT_10061 [Giardia muris]
MDWNVLWRRETNSTLRVRVTIDEHGVTISEGSRELIKASGVQEINAFLGVLSVTLCDRDYIETVSLTGDQAGLDSLSLALCELLPPSPDALQRTKDTMEIARLRATCHLPRRRVDPSNAIQRIREIADDLGIRTSLLTQKQGSNTPAHRPSPLPDPALNRIQIHPTLEHGQREFTQLLIDSCSDICKGEQAFEAYRRRLEKINAKAQGIYSAGTTGGRLPLSLLPEYELEDAGGESARNRIPALSLTQEVVPNLDSTV